jgi:hypothetical protein
MLPGLTLLSEIKVAAMDDPGKNRLVSSRSP